MFPARFTLNITANRAMILRYSYDSHEHVELTNSRLPFRIPSSKFFSVEQHSLRCNLKFSFLVAQQPYARSPHSWDFEITNRYTTLGRNPLDEWSARRRDLTKHNTHKRRTSMPPAGFKPTIPASEQPQTHALDRAAIRIGVALNSYLQFFGSTQTIMAEGFRNFPQSPKVISDNTSTQAMAISFHIFYRSLSFNATSTEILNIKYQKISCGWVKTQQCCVLTHPPDIFWYLIL